MIGRKQSESRAVCRACSTKIKPIQRIGKRQDRLARNNMTEDFEDIRIVESFRAMLTPDEMIRMSDTIQDMMRSPAWGLYCKLIEERLTMIFRDFYGAAEFKDSCRYLARGLVMAGKLPVSFVLEAEKIKKERDAKRAVNQSPTTGQGTPK